MPSSPPIVPTERQRRSPKTTMRSGATPCGLAVQLLGLVDPRRDRVPSVVRDLRDAPREIVAHGLVLVRRDHALRLAALHVQEDARVVATLPPRRRLRPVDADVPERRDAVGLGERRQQALAAEPLVDPDATVEPLRAVVGDDEDDRVLVGMLEEPGDQPVDVAVVVEDRVLVLGSPARACGARGPCTSRTRDASGPAPSRPLRRTSTASSPRGARRAGSAGRSSRRPGAAGSPCRPCGSPSCRRCTRRRPLRSRHGARPGTCTCSRSKA